VRKLKSQIQRAEVKITALMSEHNVAFLADLHGLLQGCFPDPVSQRKEQKQQLMSLSCIDNCRNAFRRSLWYELDTLNYRADCRTVFIGFGPVPWVIVEEIFSMKVKPYGVSFAAAINWLMIAQASSNCRNGEANIDFYFKADLHGLLQECFPDPVIAKVNA
ncbi:facilitated trehalose transporter Tret1-like, partial [Aphis craccivora]